MADLTAAVATSRLDGLRAIRDDLAASMLTADVPVKAQLASVLSKVMADIEAIEKSTPEVSESDRIRADLAAGLASADVVALAGRRRKSRAS